MDSTIEFVRIHYHRPPDRVDIFEQILLEWTPNCVVTFMERTPLPQPLVVDGLTVLRDGSPVLWFTFPGRWHDVGLFHTPEGECTGTYANILTPVRFLDDRTWETTDLFLDVWTGTDGRTRLLDEDELEAAVQHGHLSADVADRARAEAAALAAAMAAGEWPPLPVSRWSLERALRRIDRPL